MPSAAVVVILLLALGGRGPGRLGAGLGDEQTERQVGATLGTPRRALWSQRQLLVTSACGPDLCGSSSLGILPPHLCPHQQREAGDRGPAPLGGKPLLQPGKRLKTPSQVRVQANEAHPTSEDAGLVGMAVMGVAASPLGNPPPLRLRRQPGRPEATFYPKPGRPEATTGQLSPRQGSVSGGPEATLM